ncbi:MAG: ABC transporter permease subunit [Lachnospiraceae bacterium]
MWTIWKEEFYKIRSRKIIWLGVFLLLAFVTVRLYEECSQYTTVIDGKCYQGKEAIRKDKELTRRYAGELTKETIHRIYDEYGFFYYEPDGRTAANNYLSRLITEKFTNFMQTDGDNPEEIHFREGKDWEMNAAYLLKNEVRFDYVYGWNDFAEMYILALLALFVILLLGLSPSFAEEYQLRTADLLRTTRRGRAGGIWMKILAGLSFAILLTCAVCAYLWGIYLMVYGAQGLDASAILLNFATPYGYYPESALGFLLYLTFLGILGAILLGSVVLGISALCKSPFPALAFSLAGYLFPLLWMNVLMPMWPFGMTLSRYITHFMTSMPVYLPVSTGFGFPAGQMAVHLCIALSVAACGMCVGYYRFRTTA